MPLSEADKKTQLNAVVKYMVANSRPYHRKSPFHKQEAIRFLKLVGMIGSDAWVSRSWIDPAYSLAEPKKKKLRYMVDVQASRKAVIHFNLLLKTLIRPIIDIVQGYCSIEIPEHLTDHDDCSWTYHR